MIRGERVRVWLPVVPDGSDEFGNSFLPEYPESASTWLDGVVVAPGGTSRREDEGHDDPIDVAYTLYLPKSWTASLRRAKVTVRGEPYWVVGDPKPYTPENLPPGCTLNLVCEVVSHLG